MKPINFIIFLSVLLLLAGCLAQEELAYSVEAKDRYTIKLDSMKFTIPDGMTPDERDAYVEKLKEEKMASIVRLRQDTMFYVKSENGLDSAFVRIPAGIPYSAIKDIKNRMQERLNEKR